MKTETRKKKREKNGFVHRDAATSPPTKLHSLNRNAFAYPDSAPTVAVNRMEFYMQAGLAQQCVEARVMVSKTTARS
jgi:hypothetical protein